MTTDKKIWDKCPLKRSQCLGVTHTGSNNLRLFMRVYKRQRERVRERVRERERERVREREIHISKILMIVYASHGN